MRENRRKFPDHCSKREEERKEEKRKKKRRKSKEKARMRKTFHRLKKILDLNYAKPLILGVLGKPSGIKIKK